MRSHRLAPVVAALVTLVASTCAEARVPVRAITSGPRHHWFGYYDKLEFDPTDRYVLGMSVDFEGRSPRGDDVIEIGMVDLGNDDRWIRLGESRAWGWQQGCMLQWRPRSAHEVLWNDREGGSSVCRVLDVKTRATRTIRWPVYTVSPDGRSALSVDFRRIQDMRPGYGYAGLTDPFGREPAPGNSGIWRVDLDTGEAALIVSLADIVRVPLKKGVKAPQNGNPLRVLRSLRFFAVGREVSAPEQPHALAARCRSAFCLKAPPGRERVRRAAAAKERGERMGKDVYERKLRGGMVGGAPGALIGPVHRMAATMDGQAEYVAGCFSRDVEKSKNAGKTLHIDPDRVYSTYQEMAEKEAKMPEDKKLDFVSIVATTSFHYEIAKCFSEHGFNLICDKPMTTSLDDAKKLRDQVKKSGKVFALTHNYTGYPMVKEARHRIKQGEVGRVNKVVVEYPQGWLSQLIEGGASEINMWRMDPSMAGPSNCTGDIGIHAENLCRYVTGLEVDEVCAEVTSFIPDHKLDDDSMTLLHFKGGAKGILYASQISSGEENGLNIRVYGTKKGLQWWQENPNYLVLKDPAGFQTRLSRGNPGLFCEAANEKTRIPFGHPEGFIEAFANIYLEAFKAVRAEVAGDKIPECDHPTVDDGVIGLAFIATVLESSKSDKKWTKMKS